CGPSPPPRNRRGTCAGPSRSCTPSSGCTSRRRRRTTSSSPTPTIRPGESDPRRPRTAGGPWGVGTLVPGVPGRGGGAGSHREGGTVMSVNATRECAPARITAISRDATGATRVAVAGELDIASAADFSIELAGLIEERGPDIVVDVCGLTFCDARGLAAFVAADGRARSRGGSVTLTGVRSQLARILHV